VTEQKSGVQYLYIAKRRSTYSTYATLYVVDGVDDVDVYVDQPFPVIARRETRGTPATVPASAFR
jgi:hypothetical protein